VIRRVRPSLLRLSRSPARLASSLPAGLALLLAASCAATTDTTTITAVVPTSLTIDPATFLGGVTCSNQAGALKSYVATLSETTANKPRIVLASSPPTPCSQPVAFRYVLEGHQYTVAVDGYDVPASALVPCGGRQSGSRFMLDAATTPAGACAAILTAGAVPVIPRWQTSCGDVSSSPITDGDVVATCEHPFDDVPGNAPTAIVVDPRGALGMLACVPEGDAGPTNGTITDFDILPDDASFTPVKNVPCESAEAVRTYAKNLVPGATYTFQIAARNATDPGSPKYAATCSAVARAGFTIPALCGPLTQP
jgi:hypothetical protein